MKKLLLLTFAAAIVFAISVNAQPRKGDWMVGANIASGTGYLNTSVPHQFNFNFNPSGGYFLSNRVAIGAGINFGGGGLFSNSYYMNYGFSPFVRYYFVSKEGIKANKLYLFGELSTGIGGSSFVDKVNNTNLTRSGLNVGIGPALGYLITPNVSIEGLFKVSKHTYFQSVATPPGTGVTPSIGIGFQIYLMGKKKAEKVAE